MPTRRLRHRQVIVVLAAEFATAENTTNYFGQIHQGILRASEAAGYRCRLRWIEGKLKPVDVQPYVEDPQEVLGVINLHVLSQDSRDAVYRQRRACRLRGLLAGVFRG